MITFLPQAQPRAPRNIGLNPRTLAELGNAVGDFGRGIQASKQRETEKRTLAELAQMADQGAGADQLASTLINSGSRRLADLGTQALFSQRAAAATRKAQLEAATRRQNAPTALQKNAIAAGLKPGTPEFRDFLTKGSQRGTTVNVNNLPEQTSIESAGNKKFAEGVATNQAERIDAMIQAGSNARALEGDLNILDETVIGANTNSLASIRTSFQGLADAVGVDVSDIVSGNLSDAEAVESIVNRVAPTFRVKGSGSQSDREFAGLLKSFPGLTKSVPGNKMIISTLRFKNARALQEEAIALQMESGEISRAEGQRQIRALGPLVPKQMASAIRLLAQNKLSINPTGGPQGGPDTLINPRTGEIIKWQGGKWRKIN